VSVKTSLMTLISSLSNATGEGRIRWEETADEQSFRANFHRGSVKIGYIPEFDDGEGIRAAYLVTVHNQGGKVVESFEPMGPGQFSECRSLFELARRSAFDTESVIEGITAELNQSRPR